MNFTGPRKREVEIKSFESNDTYMAFSSRLKTVKERLAELSEYGRQNSLFQSVELTEEEVVVAGEIRSLRLEKTHLLGKIEQLIVQSAGVRKEERVLTYKDTVLCNSFKNMRVITQLHKIYISLKGQYV
jgi:hypothetical protein